MRKFELGLMGWGIHLTEIKSVGDLVTAAGADPTQYYEFGWRNACVAKSDEYPQLMANEALRKALVSAGVEKDKLKLVISVATAKDYNEVSTAFEIIREMGLPGTCIGFDIYQDCMATVTALEVAANWLESQGGGYAAIVSSELFSPSIDRGDQNSSLFWGFGDGAAALIVASQTNEKPRATYHLSSFLSKGDQYGLLRPIYGGMRNPIVPDEKFLKKRREPHLGFDQMFASYVTGFDKVVKSIRTKATFKPQWLVCSQTSPGIVALASAISKVKESVTANTGKRYGHVGCSDIVFGLEEAFCSGYLSGEGIILTCCSAGWSAAYLTAP